MNSYHTGALFIFAVILTGCASKINLNTGENDYRIAYRKSPQLFQKYELPGDAAVRYITAGEDSIAVILKQAFIHDFSERVERFLAGMQLTTVRGEIAIVAKAFEMEDGKTLEFSDTLGKRGGRLIYYSEDVRSGGQFLNFSALPVFGPITYSGNPIAIQFFVLELDNAESSQVKNLLSTVAKLGEKAYAPASPVLATLDAIGSQLLSGEGDDLEFQYVFYLYPEGGVDGVPLPRVLAGDYVFIKAEPQHFAGQDGPFEKVDWGGICLDHLAGRLRLKDVTKSTDNCNGAEFRSHSYLLVTIQKGMPSIGLDVAQLFSEFEAALPATGDLAELESNLGKNIDDFKNQLTARKDKEKRRQVVRTAIDQLQQVAASIGRDRQLIALDLNDTLTKRTGFPKMDDGTPEPFSDYEAQQIIAEMRRVAKDPFDVTPQDVTMPADAARLLELIAEPSPGPAAAQP